MVFGELRLALLLQNAFRELNEIRCNQDILRKLDPNNEFLSYMSVEILDRESAFSSIFEKDLRAKYEAKMKKYCSGEPSLNQLVIGVPEGLDRYISELEKEIKRLKK